MFITILTSTWNRAHLLPRVYRSLCNQTFKDFEWVIVDDGSTDATRFMVDDWMETYPKFPLRYYRQKHSGKHIALNKGASIANGELLGVLDSDDELLPAAIENIYKIWNGIAGRSKFSGLGGLCCNIYSDPFPKSPMDSDNAELIFKYKLRGEKWGVTRTDLLRQFPFPEIPNTQYIPEGLIGLQMAKAGYKRRFVNIPFRIYHANEHDNLTHHKGNSAAGRLYYYLWVLRNEWRWFFQAPIVFIKAALLVPILYWQSR